VTPSGATAAATSNRRVFDEARRKLPEIARQARGVRVFCMTCILTALWYFAFRKSWRISRRDQEDVALTRGNLKSLSETEDHVATRLRTTSLKKAQRADQTDCRAMCQMVSDQLCYINVNGKPDMVSNRFPIPSGLGAGAELVTCARPVHARPESMITTSICSPTSASGWGTQKA
jgi:hypothetical protein